MDKSDREKGVLTQRVDKKDFITLLRSDVPVIDEAKTLIADVIEGKYKFKPGPRNKLLESPLTVPKMRVLVDLLTEEFAQKHPKLRGQSAREEAMDKVANWYGMGVSTLSKLVSGKNKIRKQRKVKK